MTGTSLVPKLWGVIEASSTEPGIIQDYQLSRVRKILPLSSIATLIVLLAFLYLFLSGELYRFYASALFIFYSLTNQMWVSVILLGVFQTLLLIPLRIIRVIRSDNIDEFQQKFGQMNSEVLQRQELRQQFNLGNRSFLFYLTDFFVQLTTFLTIGQLFLTDFYSQRIASAALYSFVPDFVFPIEHTIFKIPYPSITETVSFGWPAFIVIWLLLICVQALIGRIQYQLLKRKAGTDVPLIRLANRYNLGYFLLSILFAWYIAHHFPIGVDISIFSGNVALPNRTLNTVTAVATFATLLWFGTQKILTKSKVAKEQGVDPQTIDATQKKMFSQAMFDSAVIGLGAYFITNNIPSAFELSIFTLEVISLLSPFTLDKVILKLKKSAQPAPVVQPVQVVSVPNHTENTEHV